jgi:WD40 repeat protein
LQLIDSIPVDSNNSPHGGLACSSDGRYIVQNNFMYAFENNELTQIDDRFDAMQLILDSDHQRMYVWSLSSGSLDIWDLPPQSIINSLNLNNEVISASLDPVSGKLSAHTWNDEKVHIIDVEAGHIESSTRVNAHAFILFNNLLMSENGFVRSHAD